MGRNLRLIILGSVAAAITYTLVTNGRGTAQVGSALGGIVTGWQRGLYGPAGNAARR